MPTTKPLLRFPWFLPVDSVAWSSVKKYEEQQSKHMKNKCTKQELLEINHRAARQVVAQLLEETEKLAGLPICVTIEDDRSAGSGVRFGWDAGCGYHTVRCQREPEKFQPYSIAKGLLRIQLESEARRAGKSRVPTVSKMQERELLYMFDPLAAHQLAVDGWVWVTLNPCPYDRALEPLRLLLASAPLMVVDARLHKQYPVLRPAQFLSLSAWCLTVWQDREDRTVIPPSEKLLERTITAFDGLAALYLDWLFDGTTHFAARYHKFDSFFLSLELWQHWRSRFPAMQPGGEFEMLDDFAGILGLSGRFEWTEIAPA